MSTLLLSSIFDSAVRLCKRKWSLIPFTSHYLWQQKSDNMIELKLTSDLVKTFYSLDFEMTDHVFQVRAIHVNCWDVFMNPDVKATGLTLTAPGPKCYQRHFAKC